MPADIFSSADHYRHVFTTGLERLLHRDQLGTFILALANATFDEQIHAALSGHLRERFDELSTKVLERLYGGRPLDHSEDDVLVFLKLMAVGLDQLKMTRFRSAEPWQLQYNQLRAFRPSRMGNAVVTDLHKPFDEEGFHFNKPFLRDEVIWEGELLGHHSCLYYNKFPFAPLHALLIMDPERNQPQYLDQSTHKQAWRLLEGVADLLPGSGFGYNSRGAYSSVNHLHMQMYSCREHGFPIESSQWRHNGGSEAYPLPSERIDSVEESWRRIKDLHQQSQGYNLLYRPGHIYITPRAMQGSYRHSPWTCGFAWAEVAGAITTFCEQDFQRLDAATISAEMNKLAPAEMAADS